ncbi:MAG: hypothetical protein C0503_01875 [Gemmatimonas sp.]|nr:hypothetical protein [Gemmatimonas sp.]
MRSHKGLMAIVAVSLLAAACTVVTEYEPQEEMLATLTEATPQDSAGNPAPPPPGGTEGTGYIRGVVRGANPPGAVGDTLTTSPRIARVFVRAYRITGYTRIGPELGPLAAEVVTNAQGEFTLPAVRSGNYAVAFLTLASSDYSGTWVTAPIHATSHEYRWWVTLPRAVTP